MVALGTGAGRRRSIGRATALRLAREGADVACLDIAAPIPGVVSHGTASADELHEVVEEIRSLGRRAVAIRSDVTSWQRMHDADARCITGEAINVSGGQTMA